MIALAVYAVLGLIVLVMAPSYAGLFLLGAYCIPSNSVLPIPHEPGVLFFAKHYEPIWIAVAATLGSLIASFADYALVGAAVDHPWMQGTRDSRLFQATLRAMKRWPFGIIVLFSFTPLPISVVRVLAPAAGYPIQRYLVAQLVGRLPRFYILAWLGRVLLIPTWVIVALLVSVVAIGVLGARRGRTRPVVPAVAPAEPLDEITRAS